MSIRPEIDDLADILQPIAEQMGVPVALALVREFGGTRLHISQVWTEKSDTNRIGIELAQQLARQFGPDRIDVPRLPYTRDALGRFLAILKNDGQTVNDIALELGLSWRTISRYMRRAPASLRAGRPADDRQIDLENYLKALPQRQA